MDRWTHSAIAVTNINIMTCFSIGKGSISGNRLLSNGIWQLFWKYAIYPLVLLNVLPSQMSTCVKQLFSSSLNHANRSSKAGFILRTKIYAVYADHFAHVGRVFSATNADLRRSEREYGKYKHSYNTPTFTMDCARLSKLC